MSPLGEKVSKRPIGAGGSVGVLFSLSASLKLKMGRGRQRKKPISSKVVFTVHSFITSNPLNQPIL